MEVIFYEQIQLQIQKTGCSICSLLICKFIEWTVYPPTQVILTECVRNNFQASISLLIKAYVVYKA